MVRPSTYACAIGLIAALSGAAVSATSAAPPRASLPTAGADWLQATGDIGNTRYSALSQINTSNISHLGAAWISEKFDDGGNSRATPVVKDGIIYATAGAKAYALDGRTGKRIWAVETAGAPLAVSGGFGGSSAPQGRGTPNVQGPALGGGLMYIGLSDGHVIALDQKTGAKVWDQELDPIAAPQRGSVSANPIYVDGVIYTSLTFGEARYVGRAVALDAKTGKQLWRWDTIPAAGVPGHETWGPNQDLVDGAAWKMGGASVWLPPVVDQKYGQAYFVTGNPSPNRAGSLRPGDNLYSSSLVALDMKTGKVKWHFQAVHHDMWEMDITVPPVAYDVEVDGKVRPGLIIMRPEGTLFMLDRQTGKPLFPIEERPVPQNVAHATAPTQPFPVGKGSVMQRGCDAFKTLPKGMKVICDAFAPPYEKQHFLMPGPMSRSSQMAYSPQSGLVYVSGHDKLQYQWASDDPVNWEFLDPYLQGRTPGLVDKDARLRFAAVDPKTYQTLWTKEFRTVGVYGVGGFMPTGGGLAFHRLEDGQFVAYDARTGRDLWAFQTGYAVNLPGYPFSYTAGGEQYVAIVQGTEIFAFKLGGKLVARTAPTLTPFVEGFRGQYEDTGLIRAQTPNDFGFRYAIGPQKARVRVGQTVNFVNNSAEVRDFTNVDGTWTTGPVLPREAKAMTFDRPGHYLYYSTRQPWAQAELMVTDAAPASAPTAAGGAQPAAFQAQADRGKRTYDETCAACHGADLAGRDFAPALLGLALLSKYPDAKALYDRTRTTMPMGAPGSISNAAYLDVIAHVLRGNDKAPPGGAALTEAIAAALKLTN